MHRAPAKILALLFCCSLWSGCSTPAQPRDTLRVLSWNIHHGQGVDGALNLPRIAGIISSWEPDIVCLQEVDRQTIRAGGVDQAVELGYLLGMESAFHRCIDHQGGEYGDAILSKFKPREVRELKLPGKLEQRGLIGVVVNLAGGPLLVCSTHFDHGRDNPSRLDEARIVVDFAENAAIPVVLAGDLNALPESEVLSTLGKVFEIPRHPAPTFPADIPERRIDYILHTHIPGWQLTETRVVPEPLASDHRPVLAVFKRLGG